MNTIEPTISNVHIYASTDEDDGLWGHQTERFPLLLEQNDVLHSLLKYYNIYA